VGAYALRRMALLPILLLGITVLGYLLINAAPGDPVSMLVSPDQMDLSPQAVEARRVALGLNQPLPVRYALWLKEALTGNLGYSFVTRQPVAGVLANRLAATGELVIAALALGLAVAVPLGVLAAIRRRTWVDYLSAFMALFSVSMPSFFLGLGMIYVFSLKLRLLPTAGMFTLGTGSGPFDHVEHLAMPMIVLGLIASADLMRYTRAGMLDVLAADYVRTARSKGLAERVVLTRHALRTALLPLLTVIGLRIPQLLGGAVITETIFQWPGMGLLSIEAIRQRDYPVLMGVVLVSAIVVLLANLVTDLAYGWVDPRIRLAARRG